MNANKMIVYILTIASFGFCLEQSIMDSLETESAKILGVSSDNRFLYANSVGRVCTTLVKYFGEATVFPGPIWADSTAAGLQLLVNTEEGYDSNYFEITGGGAANSYRGAWMFGEGYDAPSGHGNLYLASAWNGSIWYRAPFHYFTYGGDTARFGIVPLTSNGTFLKCYEDTLSLGINENRKIDIEYDTTRMYGTVIIDTLITTLNTPDSVGKSYHADVADSAGEADTARASYHSDVSDSTGYADSARVAKIIYHGVDSTYLPKAATNSTFENSHVSENGDTTKIKYESSIADTFYSSEISTPGSFLSGCVAPNGDCYFGGSSVGIYVQLGGTGALNLVVSGTGAISGMTATTNGDIYAARYGYWIRKRTGGVGTFDTIPGTVKDWYAIASDIDDVLYGMSNDSLFTSSDAGTTWVFLQYIPNLHYGGGMCGSKDGGVYATKSSFIGTGDIYKKPYGESTFLNLGQADIWWDGIGSDTSGNVYAGISTGGEIYKQTNGSGNFELIQSINTISDFLGKIDGSVYGLHGSTIYQKDNEPTQTIFFVQGGDTELSGKLDIGNVPVSNTPLWILGMNSFPDNEVKKINPDTARIIIGAATPQQISDSLSSWIHARTDTLVIMFGPDDSLCFKAITP